MKSVRILESKFNFPFTRTSIWSKLNCCRKYQKYPDVYIKYSDYEFFTDFLGFCKNARGIYFKNFPSPKRRFNLKIWSDGNFDNLIFLFEVKFCKFFCHQFGKLNRKTTNCHIKKTFFNGKTFSTKFSYQFECIENFFLLCFNWDINCCQLKWDKNATAF